jgi:hypothetical protein
MKKEIIAILTRPFAKELIRHRQGHDGTQLDYVPVQHYVDRLNEGFEHNWSFELTSREIIGEQIIVEVKLTADGLVKTGLGGSAISRRESGGSVVSLADDIKMAEADALKRACRLLGIGAELYANGHEEDGGVISSPPPANGNGNNHEQRHVGSHSLPPTPLPPRERLTSAQLSAIKTIARKQGLDPSAFRQSIKSKFGIELEYLTKKQASEVISTLDANKPSNGNGSHHAWAG